MDKRDYMQISTIFRRGMRELEENSSVLETTQFYIKLFSEYLKKDDPEFDAEKFKEACYLYLQS
ncbi:hypothetical protein ES702_07433 [subsurface metagenome]